MSVTTMFYYKIDFVDVDDKVKTAEYLRQIIVRLKDAGISLDEKANYDAISQSSFFADDDIYYGEIVADDFYMYLGRRYWEVHLAFRYWNLFVINENGEMRLRNLAYQLSQVFGVEEVWYSNDHSCQDDYYSFDDWYEKMSRSYGFPKSFSRQIAMPVEDIFSKKTTPDYCNFYHDTFKDIYK